LRSLTMSRSWWRRLAQQLSSSSSAQDRLRRKHRRDFYRPRLEALEERALMTVRVWDGGALFNDKWTDFENWANGAPDENDELFFPEGNIGLLDRSTNNDFPPGTKFNKITFEGENYKLKGNPILLGSGGLFQNPSIALTGAVVVNHIEFGITFPTGSVLLDVRKGPASNSDLYLDGGLAG